MAFIEKNSEWFRVKNPLLKSGEFSKESDTGKTKAGDGKTYYNDLAYSNVSGNYNSSGVLEPKTVNPLQDETISAVDNTPTVDLTITDQTLTADVVDNSNIQKVEITKNGGAVVGTRKQLNFIEGTNITLTIADDNVNDQVDITIDASGGGGVSSVTDDGNGVVSVDNTDPANPIIGFNGVYVSGGVEGDGTSGNPLNIDTFEEDVDLLKSTGVLTGGALSIGTGGAGVATTFTIAAGTGRVVDNTVSPTTSIDFSWTQFTDVAITNLATNTISYVAIDYNGGTPQVVQSITDWTPSEFRQYIEIGVVVHANLTVVNAVNQMQSVAYNPINQFQDLTYSLGGFNISGNIFSANGANLKINKSAGYVFRQGSNYTTLTDNPHVKTLASLTQASLRMQNQTGAGSASTTDVDVNNYDVGGVTTAVPVNKYTILRIYLFVSNLVAIQRGQAYYNSLAEAKANIQLEPYVSNQVLEENGILRGFLCVQQGTTALNNTSKAAFLPAGKFGGEVGVGGLSVSTMQNTYDNSTDPEIVTDSTRGAVTIKRGSAADTDDVIEIQNGSSVQKFAVTGNGKIFTASETASRIASINSGQEIESLDTATYPSLTELSYVKGVTSSVQTQLDSKLNISSVKLFPIVKSWDGQGATVTTGNTRYFTAPYAMTITGWNISAVGTSPTCTIDIWKVGTGTTLPTVGNSIMGTKPALSSGNAVRSSTMTGWTTLSIAAGDILGFNIDASANGTVINFELEVS